MGSWAVRSFKFQWLNVKDEYLGPGSASISLQKKKKEKNNERKRNKNEASSVIFGTLVKNHR